MKTIIALILLILVYNIARAQVTTDTSNLITIDRKDTAYTNLPEINDTITPNRWHVNFLVENDSTKYTDLYLKWSKGNKSAVSAIGSAFLVPGTIPQYVSENKSYLIFENSCGPECEEIRTFSKDRPFVEDDYENVVADSISMGLFVYAPNTFADTNIFELIVVNLENKNNYPVIFNGKCPADVKSMCIDKVMFTKERVVINTLLQNPVNSNYMIGETQTVILNYGKRE